MQWVTECTGTEPWRSRCKKQTNKHTFSSTKSLTQVTAADKLALSIHFDEISICPLFNALFIRCFKLICQPRVIDCKHRSQWRHQQINTVLYRMVVVYEKKNRSLVFSGSRKIPTLGSTVQWETRQASFPTGTVGHGLGFFYPHWTPMMDSIYLTHPYQP